MLLILHSIHKRLKMWLASYFNLKYYGFYRAKIKYDEKGKDQCCRIFSW